MTDTWTGTPRDDEERELVEHVYAEHEWQLVGLDPDDDRAPAVLHVEFHDGTENHALGGLRL